MARELTFRSALGPPSQGRRRARISPGERGLDCRVGGFRHQANQCESLSAIRNVVDDPTEETVGYIRRDVLNLATRSTDDHARNTAVQTVDGITRPTSLFDFAPTYLDPAGIARPAHRYRPGQRRELRDSEDIPEHLGQSDLERPHVVEALVRLGE